MNLILKQLLIIVFVFLIVLWFQKVDDKKQKKTRTGIYDEYKLPLLVSAMVGLVLSLPQLMCINEPDITIITPIKECGPRVTSYDSLPWINLSKDLSDQQVFTDLPNF